MQNGIVIQHKQEQQMEKQVNGQMQRTMEAILYGYQDTHIE